MKNIYRFAVIFFLGVGSLSADWVLPPPATAIAGAKAEARGEVDLGSTPTYAFLWVQAPDGTWSKSFFAYGSGVRIGYGNRTFSTAGTWTWQVRTSATYPSETSPTGTLMYSATTEATAKTATTFTFSNLAHVYSGFVKTASVTPNPANASYTTDLTKGPGVGSYTVTATATGTFGGSGSATLVISAGTPSSPSSPSSDLVGTLPGSVSVDNKGAANYSLPLSVPPGRGGLQPSLSLIYNSAGGNGPLGLGWALSYGPSKISRGRSILARDGYVHGMSGNYEDRLYLDGRLLVVVNNTSTAEDAYWQVGNVYRTEVDSFVKITALGLNGALTSDPPFKIEAFKVEGKDGSVSYFGRIDNNSADALHAYSSTSYSSIDWAIKRTVDAVGNSIEYTYNVYQNDKFNFLNSTGGRLSGEHLLAGIDYTANTEAGIAASFGVRLTYTPGPSLPLTGEVRRDGYNGYVAHHENESIRRLVKIEAGPLREGVVDSVIRYDFAFETSPGTGLSRLRHVSYNSNVNETAVWQATPPTVFTYNDEGADAPFQDPAMTSTPVSAWIVLTDPYNSMRVVTGDFNGDGRTDKYFNGKVYLGNDSGFSEGVVWLTSSGQYAPDGEYIRAGDVNGDGLSDIICYSSGSIYVGLSTGSGFVGSATYLACNLGSATLDPDIAGEYPGAASSRFSVGDFNGDGRTDILIHVGGGSSAPAGLHVGLSNGTGFSAPVRWGGVDGLDYFYRYWTGTPGYYYDWTVQSEITPIEPMVADFNGDGIDDYAYIQRTVVPASQSLFTYETSLRVAISYPSYSSLSQTSIQWQTKMAGSGSPEFTVEGAPVLKAWPGDCNADGYTDLLVLCERAVSPGITALKWCLFPGNASGVSDMPVEDYMPIEDPIDSQPNHNLDLTIASYLTEYFYPGQQMQTGGMFLQDINKDGYPDFIYGRGEYGGWLVKLGQKDGFGRSQQLWTYAQGALGSLGGTPYLDSSGQGGISMETVDVDGDGAADWLLTTPSAAGGGGIYVIAKGRNAKIDKLAEVTNGVGAKTQIAYKSTSDSSVYTPGAAVAYPIQEIRRPQLVVSDVWHDSGASGASDRAQFSYQYSGNRLDLSGRGSLGFHSFVTLDHQTNLFKYQFLAQSFPMTGLTARDETYRYLGSGGFRLISSHDNTVVFDKVVESASDATAWGTVYPFIAKAVEYRWEDADTAHFTLTPAAASSQPAIVFRQARPDGHHIRVAAESWFDQQTATQTSIAAAGYQPSDTTTDDAGVRTNVLRGVSNFAAGARFDAVWSALPGKITYGNLIQLSTDFGDGFKETVATTYHDPTTNGLTGLVKTVTTTVESPGYGIETAPVKSYTYWEKGTTPTPLVKTETIDASDYTLDLTTRYERDDLGRVTETKIEGYDNPASEQHIGSYTVSKVPNPETDFDDRFDLPKVTENAYGHPTTILYHPLSGLPTSVKDVNGAEITTEYDALARKVRVVDVLKNLETTTEFEWTSASASDWTKTQTVSPPTGVSGVTLSSAYAARVKTTVQPSVTTYYDRLARPIRTIKEGFGTQQAITDTIYNVLGQVVATSLPYPSDGTKYWSKTTYDDLGRVATVTAPNNTVTTNTYNGRATKVSVDAPALGDVDPAAQVNATVVDAKGRTVRVWNADNVPSFTDTSGTTSTAPSIAFALDGFGRMRETVLKGQEQTITATYDALGRQLTLNDPDKGPWSYVNNALGQVVKQTDARNNVTKSTFDQLGRPLTRITTEPSNGPIETATFHYYDEEDSTALHLVAKGDKGWIGAPQREEADTTGAPGFDAPRTINLHYYDAKGQPALDLAQTDGKWFYTYTDFDDYSRVSAVRHFWKPAGAEAAGTNPYLWQDFGYTYAYDGNSYLTSLTDSLGRSWWDSPSYDHLDRVTSVRKGSGPITTRSYRAEDGVLTGITTGVGPTQIQNLTYNFDGLGNLTKRTGTGGPEELTYDNLNRLKTSSKQLGTTAYADNGNITSKPDVANQMVSITGYDSSHPHAAKTYTHNNQTYTITYDANGNLATREGGGSSWSMKWAGFDKPRWMAKSTGGMTKGSEFHYNANRSRVMQLEFEGINGDAPANYVRKRIYALGSTLEVNYTKTPAATDWDLDTVRIYVPGPDGIIGAREFNPKEAVSVQEKAFVYHYDHLGSIDVIMPFVPPGSGPALDKAGKPGRLSEDAWGQRRNPFTWTGAPVTTGEHASDDGGHDSLTPRGFTGHEMLDDLGLVHMNGRIYDPLLGRFLSADLMVKNPANLQDYNRYSYVGNNPLSRVDPTGFLETTITEEQAKKLKDATAEVNKRVNTVVQSVLESVKNGKMKAEDAPRAIYKQLVGAVGEMKAGNDIRVSVDIKGLGSVYYQKAEYKGSRYEGGVIVPEKGKQVFMDDARKQIDGMRGADLMPSGVKSALLERVADSQMTQNKFGETVWKEGVVAGGINLGGNAIGTDKLDHMFYDGFQVAGMSDEKALAESQAREKAGCGFDVTGVYSNADVVANMNGRQFYREVYQAAKTGTDYSFDISRFNVAGMDENKNPNQYSPAMQKVVDRNTKEPGEP